MIGGSITRLFMSNLYNLPKELWAIDHQKEISHLKGECAHVWVWEAGIKHHMFKNGKIWQKNWVNIFIWENSGHVENLNKEWDVKRWCNFSNACKTEEQEK